MASAASRTNRSGAAPAVRDVESPLDVRWATRIMVVRTACIPGETGELGGSWSARSTVVFNMRVMLLGVPALHVGVG